jgi:hypothetical protein
MPVETMGLEPTTPCLQSRCSSQLSYVPVFGHTTSAHGTSADHLREREYSAVMAAASLL